MAYSEAHWPEAKNLPTAVKRLKSKLEDLEYDALLEQNRIASAYSRQELREMEEKYGRGVELCWNYLSDETACVQCLVANLTTCGLQEHLWVLEKYLKFGERCRQCKLKDIVEYLEKDDLEKCKQCNK